MYQCRHSFESEKGTKYFYLQQIGNGEYNSLRPNEQLNFSVIYDDVVYSKQPILSRLPIEGTPFEDKYIAGTDPFMTNTDDAKITITQIPNSSSDSNSDFGGGGGDSGGGGSSSDY